MTAIPVDVYVDDQRGMDGDDDIVDAEVLSRAEVMRQRAAEAAKAGAARAGAAAKTAGGSLARRYARGARNFGHDLMRYWFDISGLEVIEAIEPGRREKAEAQHREKVVRNRAVVVGGLLVSLAWCSAGWTELRRLMPGAGGYSVVACTWLVAVCFALLVSVGTWKGKHKHGWVWPAALWTPVAVAAGALFLHLGMNVDTRWLLLSWFALTVVWFLMVAEDGNAFGGGDKEETAPPAAEQPHVVAPPSDVVVALNAAIGVRGVEPKDWTVVQGLRRVDDARDDIVLQTPGSITTRQVSAALAKFAAVMGRPQSWITIAEDGAEGVVRITIANSDQWAEVRTWPLVEAERFSVWRPMPLAWVGTSPVVVTLMFAGWLIAAVPRVGKTFLLRLLVLAWLLDETTDVAVFDLKGGRDFLMCKPMCVAFGHGRSDETIKALRDYLKWVLETDGPVRKAAFNALSSELVPAGQLTERAVAADRRLRPLLIAIDEVHWATTHEEYGEEIVDLLSKIAKDLPYLGVELDLASQRLDAKETMPTKLRNVLSNRVALKLHSSADSAMILGDAANRLGFNAAELPKVKGLCVLHGADEGSSIDGYLKAKGYLCDGVQAEKVAARALANRRRAEVVPEQEPEKPTAPELLAVARILREHRDATGEVSMRSEDVASRLETTAQRLRDATGVRARQCKEDAYRRHLYLEDVEAAIEGRQGTRPAGLRVVG